MSWQDTEQARGLSPQDETWAASCADPDLARLAVAYARMFNTLDADWMRARLAVEASYASQAVLETLEGAEAVFAYWQGKMEAIRSSGKKARLAAELGFEPQYGKPCVLLYQARSESDRNFLEQPGGYVIFESDASGKAQSVFLVCAAPHPSSAQRTGLYPGADASVLTGSSPTVLRQQAALEFCVFVLDGQMDLDVAMIEMVRAVCARLTQATMTIFHSMSEEGFSACQRMDIFMFPALVVQDGSEVLLRYQGLISKEKLCQDLQSLCGIECEVG